MRALASLLLSVALCCAWGQQSLFETVKPDIWITVQRHEAGTDLVELSLHDAKYPAETLRQQIQRLGDLVGVKPWGVQVTADSLSPGDDKMTVLRGSFALNQLTTPAGDVKLQPLVRAFAGEEVKNLSIVCINKRPTEKTLREFRSEQVAVESRADEGEIGLEYRVQVKTDDPAQITVPESAMPGEKPAADSSPKGFDWLIWTLIGLAAVAVGALVYSLLLRPRPRPSG